VPKTWEDLLKPEWRGRKLAADIRPSEIAALVPAWGLEKTLDFARKVAAQQPVWTRGASRTLASVIAGEIPIMIGPNFGSVKKIQAKDRTGALQYVTLEPVPLRFGNAQAVLATSQHRHAALLWMEWLLSAEAQKITDETQFSSAVYVPGSLVEQELRGKKLSVVNWEHHQYMEQWIARVVEGYGFPKAEDQR
jgi:ABC-type Fe3+ transport system substrate-binding protein